MKGGDLWSLSKKTVLKWWEDNAPRLSAALSYYTVFSLAPLFVIVIAVGGLVFSEKAVQQELIGQIQDLVGDEGAKAVQGLIERARKPQDGAVASTVSLIAIIIFSTGVFAELQSALNWIWRTRTPATTGLWNLLKDRLLSFILVIGIGFLLIVSLILSAALSAAGKFFGHLLPGPELVMQVLNAGVSFAIFMLLFAMMYKLLPQAPIAWKDVWIGALVTSLLFTIGKSAIGLYLGKSGVASAYGAASSLAVILLWVYYSALIFFLGAEFTYVYANEYGSRLEAQQIGEVKEPITRPATFTKQETRPFPSQPVVTRHSRWRTVETLLFWAVAGAFILHEARKILRKPNRRGQAGTPIHSKAQAAVTRRQAPTSR